MCYAYLCRAHVYWFQEKHGQMVRGCDGQYFELQRAAHAEDSLDAARANADMHFPVCSRLLHSPGRLMECIASAHRCCFFAAAVGDSASGVRRCG